MPVSLCDEEDARGTGPSRDGVPGRLSRQAPQQEERDMRQSKAPWVVVLVIGAAMIVLPFAISLPSKASAGQKMINAFHPIMQPAHVARTVAYYDQTFVPLKGVSTGAVQAASELPAMLSALARPLHMTPTAVAHYLASGFPAMGGLLGALPKLTGVFAQVPGGLAYYGPLVRTMQTNVHNYQQIDSLPNFTLFTWFFVIPGALLVLLSLPALVAGRRRAGARTVPAAA